MERLFVTLLNMSLTASWIVGAVVLFRFVFRRAPKWILCLMWGLVALRLVIPVFLESPTSLLPTTQPVEVPVVYTQPVVQYTPSEDVEFLPVPEQPVTEQLQPVLTPSVPVAEQIQEEESGELEQVPQVHDTPEKSVFYWCGIVWSVGVCIMIAYCIFSYLRLYLLVREHIPVEKGVYICDRVNTPFILGLIRPKIYLPVALSTEDKVYVLAHEFAHIRRKDHWWKPIGFLLLSVYWFNPVMWLAYILLCRDIEGACDEKVIKQLGEDQKKPYSNALINCSAPARLVSACPLAFGEGKLRSRIKSVLHYKKPTLWIVLLCLIAGIVIGAAFLTDPLNKAEQDGIEESYPGDSAESEKESNDDIDLTEPIQSFDEIWELSYPTVEDTDGKFPDVNENIKNAVQDRLEQSFGINPKVIKEYTSLDYTITLSTDRILSFYYEGIVCIDYAAVTKIKEGFTFDPRTGRQLTLLNFAPDTEELAEQLKVKWYEQLEASFHAYMDLPHNSETVYSTLNDYEHNGCASFYIDQNGLYIVYDVVLAMGSYHTLFFDWNELRNNMDFYDYYLGIGVLRDHDKNYDVAIYYNEEQPYEKRCFLSVKTKDKTLTQEIGVFDIVALWNGSLYIDDLDGDQIDEVIVHLLVSPNGGSETRIYKLESNSLRMWYDLEDLNTLGQMLPEPIFIHIKFAGLQIREDRRSP